MEQLINKLKSALKNGLPGADAQYLMAPFHRQRIEEDLLTIQQFKPSAVLIAICIDTTNEPFIPLIERMAYNGFHSGQISLPGGKFDRMDLNLEQTAIRECEEEIGLNNIELIGQLTPIKIPVSRFLVHPFIGVYQQSNPNWQLQPREVKSILKFRLKDLMNETTVKTGEIKLPEKLVIQTNWYEVEGYQVWGATAMILSELKEVIKTIS